jgi:dTDP-4-amino-4,6-dideoxygalactose transaminase
VLPISRPSLPSLQDYVDKLEQIWSTRLLSNFGTFAHQLESLAQSYVGNPNVRATVNCDIGLLISIAALEIPAGSECLVPSFTFNSTLNAVVWNRLTPRFVDIDADTFNVDIDDVRRRLGPRTRLLVATHVFGSPVDIEPLLSLTASRRIPVVFDSAHAYGASYHDKKIGNARLGDFQVFSLSGTKQVTSAEGGLIAARSDEHVAKIELLRAYGFNYDYISRVIGINGKISELHAALGTLTLPAIYEVVRRRNQIASLYRARMSSIADIRFQEILPECLSSYKDFAILCPSRRDELAEHLERHGVQTKKYFRPLHEMPAYQQFRSDDDDLRDTMAISSRVLCLPIFNELRDGDIEMVTSLIGDFYRH